MMSPEDAPDAGIGAALRGARVAQGLSLYALAFDLNLSVHILEAIENEAWGHLPPGRVRPYTRQIAERLGLDPEAFTEQWRQLPGSLEQEPPDPRREHLERILVAGLTAGTLLLVLWLVVPGRNLRQSRAQAPVLDQRMAPARWKPSESPGPYPVVGEVLPEVPVNEEGVLVSMRAQDVCGVTVARDGDPASAQKRSLRISEPWRLRMKGPFTVVLDNGGVVVLDVAGRRIRHGTAVGQPWTGKFTENGEWIVPEAAESGDPPTAPETEEEGE